MKSVITVFDKAAVKKAIKKLRRTIEHEIQRKTGWTIVRYEDMSSKGLQRVYGLKNRDHGYMGTLRFDFVDNGKTVTLKFEFSNE